MFVNMGEHILCLMLPVRSTGMQRLIGLVPPDLSHRHDLTFEDIRAPVERLAGVRVTEVNWFSAYRVHHRVADRFQVGRAFLLGDAGHIHSPAGGQGMNTGIGDAVNLGWKLAQVVQGRAPAALLESYEAERIGFARRLVATTDRVFAPMVHGGVRGALMRRVLAPLVLGGRDPVRADAPRRVPHAVADAHPLRRQPAERGAGGRGARWGPAAVGNGGGGRQLRAAAVAGLAGACVWGGGRGRAGGRARRWGCRSMCWGGGRRPRRRGCGRGRPMWCGRTGMWGWRRRGRRRGDG